MALGEFKFYLWRSKADVQKEAQDYEAWAFPYGQKQRERLVKLLLELFPKESEATTLIPFLTAKELFLNYRKSSDMTDDAVEKMLEMKKYKRVIRKKEMAMYTALAVADSQLTDAVEYPTADEIRAMAKGFEVIKANN